MATPSNVKVPLVPCPTVRLPRDPVAGTVQSIVTTSLPAMVTSSPDTGTTPPAHVAVELHSPPPVPLLVIVEANAVALNPTITESARMKIVAVFLITHLVEMIGK